MAFRALTRKFCVRTSILLLKVPQSALPRGRAGRECCSKLWIAWVWYLPQTDEIIRQSSSAKQDYFKVQWVWAMAKTVWNHHDNKERWPDSSMPRQPLQIQNLQWLSPWTRYLLCQVAEQQPRAAAFPAEGLDCISAAPSIFAQAFLTGVSWLPYLIGTTGNWICFALQCVISSDAFNEDLSIIIIVGFIPLAQSMNLRFLQSFLSPYFH